MVPAPVPGMPARHESCLHNQFRRKPGITFFPAPNRREEQRRNVACMVQSVALNCRNQALGNIA